MRRIVQRGGRTGFVVSACVLAGLIVAVARAASGALDPSFGGDGKVQTDFGSPAIAEGVSSPRDKKLDVAGHSADGNFAVARYLVDGKPSTNFGGDGTVSTDFDGRIDAAYAITYAINAGKAVTVAVGSSHPVGDDEASDFALAQYAGNGALVKHFDHDGRLLTDFGDSDDEAYGVGIQKDGKIVVAGVTDEGTGKDFALARYKEQDGILDPRFGTGGKVVTDLGSNEDVGRAMAIREAGSKILVVGSTLAGGGGSNFALARYDQFGALDPNFGTGGIVITDFGGDDVAYSVVFQPNGQAVVAGESTVGGRLQYALARYTFSGALDPNFGTGGKVLTAFDGTTADSARGVGISKDGRIVAGGWSEKASPAGDVDFSLARYMTDGTLDPAHGTGGMVLTDFAGNSSDRAHAIHVRLDGVALAAGETSAPGGSFAVARYTK